MALLIVRNKISAKIDEDVRCVAKSMTDPKVLMGYWYKRCIDGISTADMNTADVYLAYVDGDVTGVAIVSHASTISTIELIMVDNKKQGSGVGTKMIQNILSSNELPIRLEVHVDNTRAMALYRRLGFKIVDAHGDFIVMRRRGAT